PAYSYPSNWLIVVALLDLWQTDTHEIEEILTQEYTLPEHRGELVATVDGVDYYNDSKSTIFESTLAAVKRLADKPLILLLGGISKGVDRISRVSELKNLVNLVICFGAEAEQLSQACAHAG